MVGDSGTGKDSESMKNVSQGSSDFARKSIVWSDLKVLIKEFDLKSIFVKFEYNYFEIKMK